MCLRFKKLKNFKLHVDSTCSAIGFMCPVRIDFTHMRVIENKNMCADSTRMCVELTRMRVVRKNNNNKNNKLSTRLVPVDLRFMCIMMS
jgi:hypothetical protein